MPTINNISSPDNRSKSTEITKCQEEHESILNDDTFKVSSSEENVNSDDDNLDDNSTPNQNKVLSESACVVSLPCNTKFNTPVSLLFSFDHYWHSISYIQFYVFIFQDTTDIVWVGFN